MKIKALLSHIHKSVRWLASVAGITKDCGQDPKRKCLGCSISLLKPHHSPWKGFQPHNRFLCKGSMSWRWREEGKAEWEAHDGHAWDCERPWWPSWGLVWESAKGAAWKWSSKKRELEIWAGKCCLPSSVLAQGEWESKCNKAEGDFQGRCSSAVGKNSNNNWEGEKVRYGQYRVVSGLWQILHFLGSTTHLSMLLTATCDPGWITAGFWGRSRDEACKSFLY